MNISKHLTKRFRLNFTLNQSSQRIPVPVHEIPFSHPKIRKSQFPFYPFRTLCFVLSGVENYFVLEPNNSKKQICPGKHGNLMFICP
jgi:hypothetical protein